MFSIHPKLPNTLATQKQMEPNIQTEVKQKGSLNLTPTHTQEQIKPCKDPSFPAISSNKSI